METVKIIFRENDLFNSLSVLERIERTVKEIGYPVESIVFNRKVSEEELCAKIVSKEQSLFILDNTCLRTIFKGKKSDIKVVEIIDELIMAGYCGNIGNIDERIFKVFKDKENFFVIKENLLDHWMDRNKHLVYFSLTNDERVRMIEKVAKDIKKQLQSKNVSVIFDLDCINLKKVMKLDAVVVVDRHNDNAIDLLVKSGMEKNIIFLPMVSAFNHLIKVGLIRDELIDFLGGAGIEARLKGRLISLKEALEYFQQQQSKKRLRLP